MTYKMIAMLMLLSLSSSCSASVQLGWQNGVTTRYWDCCKPSCGWWGKAPVTKPVIACDARNNPLAYAKQSGCMANGSAFTCSNQRPFQVSSILSYGFAAVRLNNMTERDWCCKCYRLRFLDPLLQTKEMIVQATNTGWDLSNNHFDIAMPGGGQGMFQGCSTQYTKYHGGALYGGVSSEAECYKLPSNLVEACLWRFVWFMGANNPKVYFKEVPCPQLLTSITKCMRTRP
jgi:hypothetical protein